MCSFHFLHTGFKWFASVPASRFLYSTSYQAMTTAFYRALLLLFPLEQQLHCIKKLTCTGVSHESCCATLRETIKKMLYAPFAVLYVILFDSLLFDQLKSLRKSK
jgi:hypothetical protein